MKNKYIQKVKERLKRYRDLQAQHRVIMNRWLSAGDPYANISIDYSSIPAGSKTYTTSSKIETALIKSDEKITRNSEAAKELRELDLALEPLSEIQREIITKKYIDKKGWGIIADETGYSERQCQRESIQALKRMADILYGEASYIDLPLYSYIPEVM
nr:hypothetical protein [uncultured Cellulosilyticum sp.]